MVQRYNTVTRLDNNYTILNTAENDKKKWCDFLNESIDKCSCNRYNLNVFNIERVQINGGERDFYKKEKG